MSQVMKQALVMACEDHLRSLKREGLVKGSNVTAEELAYAYYARARVLQRRASRREGKS
jgi:hypothetical protein